MLALFIGFVAVSLLGTLHCFGLMAIRQVTPLADVTSHTGIVRIFISLLTLHVAEILLFAALYAGLQHVQMLGMLASDIPRTWTDYVYFSGINFVTLGYTQIETQGSIRMIATMQSLGGFMVLTWSATFVYSVWGRIWSSDGDQG